MRCRRHARAGQYRNDACAMIDLLRTGLFPVHSDIYPGNETQMECTVDWGGPEGMLFVARTGSGHVTAMDGAPDGGGHNLAPRPMEMMLAGAGGCAAYD